MSSQFFQWNSQVYERKESLENEHMSQVEGAGGKDVGLLVTERQIACNIFGTALLVQCILSCTSG